jgi:hypothetical protein
VPIAVDARVATAASLSEVSMASLSSETAKAFFQYSRVNPSLMANRSRSRGGASANEKTAITAIGTST